MPYTHSLKLAAGGLDAGETHTVIFVDVDGVLNIGARDDLGGAPLLFSDANVQHAKRLVQGGGPNADHECVQKLVAINERRLGSDEEGTLGKLASSAPANVSSVLAERLAQILRAAGPKRTVVLSSSWRRPQHKLRAAKLEQEISRHLGESFTFDERTPLRDDSSAQERLECIGDFLASLKVLPKGKLRMLILEDFFITPMKSWSCNGIPMDDTEAAECYLLSRLPDSVTATARVVHTYDEWVTPRGLQVQVGVGLTLEHFAKAMDFLGGASMDVDGETVEGSDMSTAESDDASMSEGTQSSEQGDDAEKAVASSDDIVVKKLDKESNVLLDMQAQKRWLEYLSASLPWLSITNLWSL